jgi:hypothetical protein
MTMICRLQHKYKRYIKLFDDILNNYILFWRKHGALLIENIDIANLSVILDVLRNGEQIALPAEFKLSLNSYLSDLSYTPVRSLAEIIAFNTAHPIEVWFLETFNFLFIFFILMPHILLWAWSGFIFLGAYFDLCL